ncbi:MAG: hypothetical protein J2P49_05520 [Methylocapsa sp.]|nr:hypothetical protein [Methylocapsa sp.]
MFRRLSSFLSICLFAGAFIAVIIDVGHSHMAAKLTITPIGDAVSALAPEKWADAQKLASRYINLSNFVIAGFLQLPVWLVLSAAGALTGWLGRRPKPKFGFSSR